MHHLHVRKRIYTSLEQFPHPKASIRMFDYLMYAVGLLAPLALLPQVIHLFVYQNAAGLSLPTWCALGVINLLWAIYGDIHKDRLIFLSNTLIAGLDAAMVVGILWYS